MSLTLTLPELQAHPADPPETRPAKVTEWLSSLARRDPVDAARAMAHTLASTNRMAMNDSRRLDVAERYWSTAQELWPLLERRFAHASHPLTGEALACARSVLGLSQELAVAYKHLLATEADRRMAIGGSKQLLLVLQRALDSIARIIIDSYVAYLPVPAKTWLDAHRIYAFARDRTLHLDANVTDGVQATPERSYLQVLLLALANPYGLTAGQLATVLRYLQTHAHFAKLTDVQPVHRMAKAVAIIPVGHDFPPFSANKGGAIDGRKMYLLTYDLAFEIQEQLRALDAGADVPVGIARDNASRRAYGALLRRLLKQWAIPPARQFNRIPSHAPVSSCAGLGEVVRYARAAADRAAGTATASPTTWQCEVINHTPAGYALRQNEVRGTSMRIGELVAIGIEGRDALHVAIVRWFRNTLEAHALEFGCELLSDAPQYALAAPEGLGNDARVAALVLPPSARQQDAPQIVVPLNVFRAEQAITVESVGKTMFVVLTKLIEQGAGFEIYEFIAVG
ncbi:MAG: hypothetical protein M3Z31_14715 [Pseudomonadota bacterium]|nr:hypothetical protein [Pseudomonadota bacterium]